MAKRTTTPRTRKVTKRTKPSPTATDKPAVKKAKKKPEPPKPIVISASTGTDRETASLSKPQIISELTKSPHRDLGLYVPVGIRAGREDADFYAHLVAWNHLKGAVRDAKVALPCLALHTTKDPVYMENAVAHLADLDPRLFLRATEFLHQTKGPSRLTRRLVKRYLRDLESDFGAFDRVATQHRHSLKTLYTRFAVKPAPFADAAVVKGHAQGGRLAIVKTLGGLPAAEAAGLVLKHKIPFLIAKGALGKKLQDPDVLLAVMKQMSPTEVVSNAKMLEKLGIKNVPALRAAFEEALTRAAKSKGANVLKTTRAAEALAEAGDEQLSSKLKVLQEKQLDNLKGVEGDWLVLGDRSGSMTTAIEAAREIAGTLARMVKGKVYLTFFDTAPRFFDVTGKTLDEIKAITRGINAGGGTSIGCGLQDLIDRKLTVDGIAVVTDGGENSNPYFSTVYPKYTAKFGNEPTVYCYATDGYSMSFEDNCRRAQIDVQRFSVAGSDYYSLPNLVQTMRVGRYSLLDEVLNVPYKSLDQVLTNTVGMEVVSHAHTATQAV